MRNAVGEGRERKVSGSIVESSKTFGLRGRKGNIVDGGLCTKYNEENVSFEEVSTTTTVRTKCSTLDTSYIHPRIPKLTPPRDVHKNTD
jgi:hypothetical protein